MCALVQTSKTNTRTRKHKRLTLAPNRCRKSGKAWQASPARNNNSLPSPKTPNGKRLDSSATRSQQSPAGKLTHGNIVILQSPSQVRSQSQAQTPQPASQRQHSNGSDEQHSESQHFESRNNVEKGSGVKTPKKTKENKAVSEVDVEDRWVV